MFEINQVGFGAYLGVLSVLDIRHRRLPVWFLAVGGALVLGVRIFCVPLDIISAAGGAVGILFLLVSKVTQEGVGYGDSLLILVMGIYLGFWNLLGVLTGAFLLSAVFAGVVLVRFGWKRSTGFPFVPFLTAAYGIWICIGSV